MTMDAEKLLEHVAREICEERCWRGAWENANEVERDSWRRDARVAIRTVLKECAKTVGDHNKAGREWLPKSVWGSITREATQRILAIAPADRTKGEEG